MAAVAVDSVTKGTLKPEERELLRRLSDLEDQAEARIKERRYQEALQPLIDARTVVPLLGGEGRQRRDELGDRRVSARPVLFEASQNDLLEPYRETGAVLRRQRGLARHDERANVGEGLAGKGPLSRHELIERCAQRPYVTPCIDVLGRSHLLG